MQSLKKLNKRLPYILSAASMVIMTGLIHKRYKSKSIADLPATKEVLSILRTDPALKASIGDYLIPVFRIFNLNSMNVRVGHNRMEVSFVVEGTRGKHSVLATFTCRTLEQLQASDDPPAMLTEYCIMDGAPSPADAPLSPQTLFWRLESLQVDNRALKKGVGLPAKPEVAARATHADVREELRARLRNYNANLSAEQLAKERDYARTRELNHERSARMTYMSFYFFTCSLLIMLYLRANKRKSIAKTELFAQGVGHVSEALGHRRDIVFNKTSIGYELDNKARFVIQFATKDQRGVSEFESVKTGLNWKIVKATLDLKPAAETV